MGFEPGLRRAVVVGGHYERAGHADVRGSTGELDRVSGVVCARAGDDRHRDRLGHCLPQLDPLVVGEHRALAGGTRHHEAVAAVVGEPAGQRDRGPDVERAVVGERRDHGGGHRAEMRHQVLTSCSAERSMPNVRSRSSCSSCHTL